MKTKKPKKSRDPIANQLTFIADQSRMAAKKLKAAGFDEIGAEFEALGNSADFFAGEYDHQKKNKKPCLSG